ncbi:hypothetical protein [Streptomyces prunicolor]|uniref:hypothetical protein n=1 Tax=Streptomyces prunicolor TaxID=67348 RepID=UPI00038091D1|nr:hypothetical protein [Streptomyces prunicolor]
MWAVGGTWERVFTALMAQADADEDLNRAVSVDSTIVLALDQTLQLPVVQGGDDPAFEQGRDQPPGRTGLTMSSGRAGGL